MKHFPIEKTSGSIEQHLRRAREQRAAFLAGLLSGAVTAAARALSGTSARIASVTRAAAGSPELATR